MKYVILAAAVIIAGIACQKEVSNEPEEIPAEITALFLQNREEVQQAGIDANSGGTIKGSKGGSFYFLPNSFVFPNGDPVTGNIDVEIKELYTPADMIWNNVPSVSNGQLLESGGEFYVNATSAGQTLKLAPGAYMRISLKTNDLANMQVFNGMVNGDTTNWVLNNSGINVIASDTLTGMGGNLFCDAVQWINCDRFIDDPKISCTFNQGNCPSLENSYIFVHLTGRNSVLKLYNDGSSQLYSEFLIATPVTIVGICAVNHRLYASITTANLSSNGVYDLNYQPISEKDLKKQLARLK